MFQSLETLTVDLKRIAKGEARVPQSFSFRNNEVGKALIQIAGGKIAEAFSASLAPDANESTALTQAAKQFVSGVMLAPSSDHFTMLGVTPDADAGLIRENFRRLMALVHPDANPVGFPIDAASRVNLAYGVIADSERRAEYVTREINGFPAPIATVAAETWAYDASGASHSERSGARSFIETVLETLRSRRTLLWVAGLLLVPIGFGLASFVSSEPPPARLVEARPNLNMSLDVSVPPAAASSGQGSPAVETPAATAAMRVDGSGLPQPAPDRAAAPLAVPAPPNDAPSTGLRLRATTTPPMTPPPTAPSVGPGSSHSRSNATLKQEMAKGAAEVAPTATVAANGALIATSPPPQSSARATDVVANADAVIAPPPVVTNATIARVATPDRVDGAARIRTAEVEDILVKFTNAYQAGSIGAFSQLLASGIAGRRQMLNDYDRIFNSTRNRSIKFNHLKHTATGDRVSTSGYATVTTTDQDNQTVTQRVFLEFDIGRERGEPRIERLANYVIN